ncbi:YobH-like protein [Pantoea piersonii]
MYLMENKMKLLIRAILLIGVIWIGMLFTGYGVLTGSTKNAAGLGLQCSYLTARGLITAQYLHTDSGVIGVTDCPLLKKSGDVIDN